jgi:hypothetical protein
MPRNPRMDESGPDGYTVFLMLYFDSDILLRSISIIHAVVGNFEGEIGATCNNGVNLRLVF